MKLTVVRRTGLGFALLLIFMTIIAGAALQTQQTTQRSMSRLADEVLPILQSGFSLLVSAQNINKALTQHASETRDSVMSAYENEFNSEVEQYEQAYANLSAQLVQEPAILEGLEAADQPVRAMVAQGAEHMQLRRSLLIAQAAYQEEAQAEASRWLRFPNEMQIVDRVVQVLAQNQDSQASLIGSDTNYAREKIDLVRTDLSRLATATSAEEVLQVRERLQAEV
ncbi:MAG: hypothetical protein WED11_04805, partial [Natronospirillum sp.]